MSQRPPRPYPAPSPVGRDTLTRGPAGVGAPADWAGMRPSSKKPFAKENPIKHLSESLPRGKGSFFGKPRTLEGPMMPFSEGGW
jgi:hypothetical protein